MTTNATIRDIMNANRVFTKLADNPNVYVSVSFALLPVLEFVTETVQGYLDTKDAISAETIPMEEREQKLNDYLGKEVVLPDVRVPAINLRSCGLTMVEVHHIRWWLVGDDEDL